MESQMEKYTQSNVVKIDSKDSWDSQVDQATTRSCPIVVHFTAEWCMPSVAMNSVMEELASSNEDMIFLSVDVDDNQEVAHKYEVKAMPTFLLLKDGVPADKFVGANPDEIKKRVHSLFGSNHAGVVM